MQAAAAAAAAPSSAQGLAFSISPAKKQREHNEDEDYYLTLAPFSRAPKINFGEVKVNALVERTLHIFNPQQFEIKLNVSNQDLCINNMEIAIDEKSSVDFKIRWQPDKADYYKYSIFFEVVNGARLKFLVHAFGICVAPPPKPTARKPFHMLQPVKKEKSSGPVLQPVPGNGQVKKPAGGKSVVVTTLKTPAQVAPKPAPEKKPFLKAKNKENAPAAAEKPTVTTTTCVSVSSVVKPSKYTYGTTRAHTILSSTVTKTKKHRVPIDFYESYTGEEDGEGDSMTAGVQVESEEALRRKTCIITTPSKMLKMIVEHDPIDDDDDDSEMMAVDARFQFNSTKALRRSTSAGNLTSPFAADSTVIMAAGAGRAGGSEFGSRSVHSSTSNLSESPTVSSTLKKPAAAMSASNPHLAKFMSSNRGEFVAYLEPLDDTPTLLSKERDRAHGMDLTPKLCDFTCTAKSAKSSTTIATTQLIDISACSSHITNSTLLYGSTTPRAHQAAASAGARSMRLSGFNSTYLEPGNRSSELNFETSAVNSSDPKEAFSNVTVIVNNRTKDLTTASNSASEVDMDDPPRYFNWDSNHPSLIRSVVACQRAWRLKRQRKEEERISRLNLALKSIDELKSTIMSMDTIRAVPSTTTTTRSGEEGGAVVVMNHVEKLKRERENMVRCLINCQRWLRMKRFRRALDALKRQEQARREHEHLVACVLTCQRAVRMKRFRARLAALKRERAVELERTRVETVARYAVICQRAVRIKNLRRSVRAIKHEREEQERRVLRCATICQRAVRMKNFRKRLAILKHERDLEIAYQASLVKAALMVQRALRMRAFRRNLVRLRAEKRARDEEERQRLMQRSALVIQRVWHLYKFRRAMKRYRTSAVVIQKWLRDDMKQRLAYLKLRRTVVHLQQLSRRRLAARQAAALKIQAYWRMHVERRKYERVVKSALVIQRWYRSKADRLAFVKLKRVTLCIQARARFVMAKRAKMATRIQRAYRMYRFRQAMDRYRGAAVTIQRWTRAMALRYEHIKKLRIVIKIQRLYRHVYMVRRLSAAVKIQRAWRCAKARRELEMLRAQELENRYVNRCATRIQALWRGYWVRKQTDHVLNSIRSRLSVYVPANLPGGTCSDNTLGARIRQSLSILSCYQEVPIQQMIFALTDLDKVTKLSPECCATFIEEGAVTILYSFIGNCNRSIPHMDLIRYCLQIFINLAKYGKTVEHVLCPLNLALTTLANLFQYYHISNPIIFMDVCILFILIAQSERMVAELNEQPTFIGKLVSLHSIIERKTSYTLKRYPNAPTPVMPAQARSKLPHQPNSNPNESTLSNLSVVSLPTSVSNSSISSIASNPNTSSTTYAVSNSTCFGSASKMVAPSSSGVRKVVVTLEPDWVLGSKKTTIELIGQLGALEFLLNTLGVKPASGSQVATGSSTGKTPRKSVSMHSIGEAAATVNGSGVQKKVSRKIIK